jgi:hypothetical protein
MPDLSPAAQAVLDAFYKGGGQLEYLDRFARYEERIGAALRAAAVYCTRERRILMTIADELEGQ